MALLINDTMTDTDGTVLQSHTPDQGGSYSKYPGYTEDAEIHNDGSTSRLRSSLSIGGLTYVNSQAPPIADYRVLVDVRTVTLLDTDFCGLLFRADSTVAAGSDTYYYSDLSYTIAVGGLLRLFEAVAGVFTEIGSYAPTIAAGNTYALEIRGTGSALEVYFEGVQRISVTDSSITAAGKAGLYCGLSTDTTGFHLDNYQVIYTASLLWRPGPVPSLVAR